MPIRSFAKKLMQTVANALLVKILPDGRSGRYRNRYASGCVSSVVRWAQRFRQTGSVAAKWVAIAIRVSRTSETGCSLGSLRRLICRFKNIRRELAARNVHAGYGWRIFAKEKISFKKSPLPSRIGLTSRPSGHAGDWRGLDERIDGLSTDIK